MEGDVPEVEWVLGESTVEPFAPELFDAEPIVLEPRDASTLPTRTVYYSLIPSHEPNKVYDKTRNVKLSSSDFVLNGDVEPGDTVRISRIAAAFDAPDAGARRVTVTFQITQNSTTCNYVLDPATITIDATITRKPLRITPTANQSKVYGDSDPDSFRASVSGLFSGDSVGGNLGREPGEDAGEYAFTVGTVSAGDNYESVIQKDADGNDVVFTITPKPLSDTNILIAYPDSNSGGNYAWTGNAVDPNMVLKYGDRALVKGMDYDVVLTDNVDPGTATAQYTGKGNYTGTRSRIYRIVQGSTTPEPGSLEINAANFPDSVFRTYIQDNIDDGDGYLSQTEIRNTTRLNLNDMGIHSLEGIQYFTSLCMLDCDVNPLESLDISNNTKLEQLSCFNCQLTQLDVSKNTDLQYLFCSINPLKALDVTRCPKLLGLNCAGCELTALDLSKNTVLEFLECEGNQLKKLDFSHNVELERAFCAGNLLTALDVSRCPLLMAFVSDGNYHDLGDVAFYGTFFEKFDYDLMEFGIQFDRGVVINGGKIGSGSALILPHGTQSIGDEAFMKTTATFVIIREGCKSIGSKAFANCANLRRISIPDSVTYIADDAFSGCPLLRIATYQPYATRWAEAHGIPCYTP